MAVRTEARRCLDKFKLEYADTLCRVGEVLLSFSSGILTVVTFGTAFWLQATVNKSDPEMVGYHQGLWQNCTNPIGPNGCETISLNAPGTLPRLIFIYKKLISAPFFSSLLSPSFPPSQPT